MILLQNKKTTFGLFVSGIALMIVLASTSLGIGWKIQYLNKDMTELNKAIITQEELLQGLREAQNGVRGFILTNNIEFMSDYFIGIQLADEIYKANIEQIKNISNGTRRLPDLLAEHEKNMSGILDAYHAGGRDAAIETINLLAPKKTLRTINVVLHNNKKLINDKIEIKKDDLDFTSLLYSLLSIAALFVTGALSFAQFYLFRRQLTFLEEAKTETQTQNKEVAIFSRLSEALHSAMSREESYEIIQSYGRLILGDAISMLYVYNNSRDQLRLAAHWGVTDETPAPDYFAPDECWALRRGRIYSGAEIEGQLNCAHHLNDHPRNYMCMPITAAGQISGLLYVYTGKFEQGALDRIKRQAVIFADQLSLALVNLDLRERLQHLAIQDSLTGLYNRRVLDDMLHREFARAERNQVKLSVLMLDIDHFKNLNDTYGHSFGDQALKLVSTAMKDLTRQTDIVCRYGGEEFLIAFPDCNTQHAIDKAIKIQHAVKELKLSYNNIEAPSITISIGLATYPDHAKDEAGILRLADKALYQAKQTGRDKVCIPPNQFSAPEADLAAIPAAKSNGLSQAAI